MGHNGPTLDLYGKRGIQEHKHTLVSMLSIPGANFTACPTMLRVPHVLRLGLTSLLDSQLHCNILQSLATLLCKNIICLTEAADDVSIVACTM